MSKFQNFELNEEQRRLQMLKHQQRMDLRAQYWKKMTNPNAHAHGEGGTLFDPAMLRFQAMRVSHSDHFKPTGKAAFWGFALLIVPVTACYLIAKKERDGREHRYRNGEVSYKDREFKFI